jgi:hypothetical protein
MPAIHDTNERQQAAIWPWILMPLVVLLLAYGLDRFKDAAQNAAQSQVPSAPTAATGGTTDP